MISVLPSIYSRWCSATWAMIAVPALPLPEIHLPAKKVLYGEFLTNAQGEDVVAGIRTPRPISELKDQMPEMYKQFVQAADTLEHHYKDMQDIEFTIERGRLYMLQTRNGKRTGRAAVQVAYDLVQENILTPAEAIMKVEPAHI